MVMRRFICFAIAMFATMALHAQQFEAHFNDETLLCLAMPRSST